MKTIMQIVTLAALFSPLAIADYRAGFSIASCVFGLGLITFAFFFVWQTLWEGVELTWEKYTDV